MINQPLPGMPAPTKQESNYRSSKQCAGCGKRWGGLLAAHCAVCHQTFISVEFFDKHTHKPTLEVVR